MYAWPFLTLSRGWNPNFSKFVGDTSIGDRKSNSSDFQSEFFRKIQCRLVIELKKFCETRSKSHCWFFLCIIFSKISRKMQIFDHWSQICKSKKIDKISITDRQFCLSNSKKKDCVWKLPDRNCTFSKKTLQAKALIPNPNNEV